MACRGCPPSACSCARRRARRRIDSRAASCRKSRCAAPHRRNRPVSTEHIDPRYAELDSWSTAEMLAAMYEGQLAAAAAVQPAVAAIASAVDDAAEVLKRGGRIVYVGAGTSGRIGVQDGTELSPTFDWPAGRLIFLMAGGMAALTKSAEAAEDSEADGARAVSAAKIGPCDVVIG